MPLKKWISLVLALCLTLCMFTGCDEPAVTQKPESGDHSPTGNSGGGTGSDYTDPNQSHSQGQSADKPQGKDFTEGFPLKGLTVYVTKDYQLQSQTENTMSLTSGDVEVNVQAIPAGEQKARDLYQAQLDQAMANSEALSSEIAILHLQFSQASGGSLAISTAAAWGYSVYYRQLKMYTAVVYYDVGDYIVVVTGVCTEDSFRAEARYVAANCKTDAKAEEPDQKH